MRRAEEEGEDVRWTIRRRKCDEEVWDIRYPTRMRKCDEKGDDSLLILQITR